MTTLRTEGAPPRVRRTLPPAVALIGVAITFTSMYLAAGALTPLLVVYRREWGFPASLLTVAFAVYAVGFLAALLTLGALSDFAGRRPVLIGALVIQLGSNAIFLVAPDVGWIIAGRVLQGIATGAATSALTAMLVEVAGERRKRLGTILGSASVTGGLAIGSLLAGAAIQLTTGANSLIFCVLIVLTAVGMVTVRFSPETVTRTAGALRSLRPRVSIPSSTRREFVAAAPAVAAVWMLAGLSGGLAPSMVHSVFHLDSGLLDGVSGFIAPAVSTIVGLSFARIRPRTMMSIGVVTAVVGPLGIVAGVLSDSLTLMSLGQAVSGVAFGAAFTATLRLIIPLAAAHERARVVASIYIVSYLAFGIPIVIAGQLGDSLGVVPTVVLYSIVTILLALMSLIGQVRLARRSSRHP